MSPNHTLFQNQILSGRPLNQAEQAAFDAHLATCPECRALAAADHHLSQALPRAYPAARHAPREIDVKARAVHARLNKRRWTRTFFQGSFMLAAAGASVVLLLVIFSLLPSLNAKPADGLLAATQADALPSTATPTRPAPTTPPAVPTIYRTLPVGGQPLPTASRTATAEVVLVQTGSSIPGVAYENQTAYLGMGSRLVAVDIRTPDAPQLAAQSPELPGQVLKVLTYDHELGQRVVVSAGRYLVVLEAGSQGELGVITQSKLPGPISALLLDLVNQRLYAGGALRSDPNRGFISVFDPTPPDRLDLLNTIEMNEPVQGMALVGEQLFVIHNNLLPKIVLVPLLKNDQFSTPLSLVSTDRPLYSLAVGGHRLYVGSDERLLIYEIIPPSPQATWHVRQVEEIDQPGRVLGLVLRGKTIYTAGVTLLSQRFQQVVSPAESIQAGSVVDSASYLSVGYGQMLVAGEPLEIFSILGPQPLTLLGSFPPVKP